jgi:hypothetical protein
MPLFIMGRYSSVGAPTTYGWDGRGSIAGRGKIFSSPHSRNRLWGDPTFIKRMLGWGLSPEIELPESETNHSPPSSIRSKTVLYPHSSRCLYGVVLEWLSTGITSLFYFNLFLLSLSNQWLKLPLYPSDGIIAQSCHLCSYKTITTMLERHSKHTRSDDTHIVITVVNSPPSEH